MKKALLLHGRGGSSQGAWFPWLKKELELLGYTVTLPDLPNTDNPVKSEQLGHLEENDYDIIVAHSLGCQLTTFFLERGKLTGKKIVMVSPSYPGLAKDLGRGFIGDSYDNLSAYFDSKVNLNSIKDNDFTVFLSDDDSYIDAQKAKDYYSIFNPKILEFNGMGHFNTAAGVFKLPEVLDYI